MGMNALISDVSRLREARNSDQERRQDGVQVHKTWGNDALHGTVSACFGRRRKKPSKQDQNQGPRLPHHHAIRQKKKAWHGYVRKVSQIDIMYTSILHYNITDITEGRSRRVV